MHDTDCRRLFALWIPYPPPRILPKYTNFITLIYNLFFPTDMYKRVDFLFPILYLSFYYSACIPWCNWCTFGGEEIAQATWGGTQEVYFKHVNDITIVDVPLLSIHILYNIPGEERTGNWGGCEDCYSQLWWTGTSNGLNVHSEKCILCLWFLCLVWIVDLVKSVRNICLFLMPKAWEYLIPRKSINTFLHLYLLFLHCFLSFSSIIIVSWSWLQSIALN